LEDSILVNNISFEIKKCMEELTHLDLDSYVEEVGREDHHLVAIVKFFKKYMGIYDFQLSIIKGFL